ncbi:spore cortex biosynthesis protein YabQ [Porcipelethomonas sp.]|uniref:spore cortex biosynthesis protein YabQ n=1 Tax=Porcipelethomonas sp. TaxID=2981675 RepID=UPI003EF30068
MEGLESFFTWSEQLRLFLLSCLFGIPVGIVFDLFRVFRMLIPHNKIAAAAEDLIFFCLYGIFLMCFTVTEARSEFRFYFCIGNFLGFALYFVTVGSAVTSVLRKIIMFIKKIFAMIFRPVVKKFVLICEKFRAFFVRTLQNLKIDKKNSKTPLIDNGDLLYNRNNDIKKNLNIRKNVKNFGSSKGSKKKKEKGHV